MAISVNFKLRPWFNHEAHLLIVGPGGDRFESWFKNTSKLKTLKMVVRIGGEAKTDTQLIIMHSRDFSQTKCWLYFGCYLI